MLTYKYNLSGGCLKSIIVDNEERQYQPIPDSWGGQDVVIFPFIARLKNQSFTHKGITYSMKNHGLARYNDFKEVEEDENSTTLAFESNEDTLKQYPFPFLVTVIYKKDGNTLYVEYKVKNTGTETMPFGLGAHPAIKVSFSDDDTKGNFISFNKTDDAYTQLVLDDTGSFIVGEKTITLPKKFECDKALFEKHKTLILRADDFTKATLTRKDGRRIIYRFNANYLALWSLPHGDYVCVEPWVSVPDYMDSDTEIMNKKSLVHLEAGCEYKFSYSMEFVD